MIDTATSRYNGHNATHTRSTHVNTSDVETANDQQQATNAQLIELALLLRHVTASAAVRSSAMTALRRHRNVGRVQDMAVVVLHFALSPQEGTRIGAVVLGTALQVGR
jgi:uncharacterized protein YyaL (SSP411 family)